MTASSSVNENYFPRNGRLLNPVSAWCADAMETHPYLDINFGTIMRIMGVATQGDPTGNNYVVSYKIGTRLGPEELFKNAANDMVRLETLAAFLNGGSTAPPLCAFRERREGIKLRQQGRCKWLACAKQRSL